MKPALERIEAAERHGHGGRPPSRSLELGTRGVLLLFFALAVICGLFFAFGYTLGRHAVPTTYQLGATSPTTSLRQSPASLPPTPAGVQPPNPAELGAAENNQTPTTLVANSTTTTSPPPPAATAAQPQAPASTANAGAGANDGSAAGADPSVSKAGSGPFHVQVFAGKKTDAESLASALQQKGYPVEVVPPGPGETDLYRVEVGPYLTVDEARAMKSRLTADGYQAIVK